MKGSLSLPFFTTFFTSINLQMKVSNSKQCCHNLKIYLSTYIAQISIEVFSSLLALCFLPLHRQTPRYTLKFCARKHFGME